MDRPNVRWLNEILETLSGYGVAMAKIGDVEIVFENSVPDLPKDKAGHVEEDVPKHPYKNSNLFQDGKVPSFTKAK